MAQTEDETLAGIERAARALRLDRLDPAARAYEAAPVIHTRSMGNLANRMIQYMAAVSLQARIPGASVASIQLPEWGIVTPNPPIREPALRIPTERIEFGWIADRIREGGFGDVVLLQYLQHVGNLLPPDVFRPVFRARCEPVRRFGSDTLLISLRMKEVLSGFYPLYTLLPVAFYREIVDRSGLRPAFFGQLTPSSYLDRLREAFPEAEFIEGVGVMEDFETIRQAPNVCVSISTFAWIAAWLGHAERIVLPINGLFSPAACAGLGSDLDLLPRHDPRFEYWRFPVNYAVPEPEIEAAHRALHGRWAPLDADAAAALADGRCSVARDRAAYERAFDASYYLATHREVADAVADGRLDCAESHFRLHGFEENRACFPLDPGWYASVYPDAADALGEGRYRDFHHFHVAAGDHRPTMPSRDGRAAIAA